jgi:surfeit locus 1 family protein
MRSRPILWLTVWAVPAFAVLIGLGTWQVQRLHWKEGLIAQRQTALGALPADLPRSLEVHPAWVTGVFRHDREFLVNATERQGGGAGFLVVTPLVLADGGVVLVERGWVPTDRKAPESREAGEVAGTVTIEGLLRLAPAGKPGWFVPDNRPERNEWYFLDLAAMVQTLAPATILPFYVEAGPATNPGGYPVGGQARTDLSNDHLQYAITWYALAASLLVIFFLYVRRERARSRPESP